MATTGIMNGTLSTLTVGGTSIAHLTSTEFGFEMETRDASSKDSGGDKDVLEGMKSFSGSGSGFFAEDAAFGFTDLFASYTARTPVTIIWGTAVVGDKTYSGSCYITSLTRSEPVEDSITFDVSFEGTGAVTEATNV